MYLVLFTKIIKRVAVLNSGINDTTHARTRTRTHTHTGYSGGVRTIYSETRLTRPRITRTLA